MSRQTNRATAGVLGLICLSVGAGIIWGTGWGLFVFGVALFGGYLLS